MTAAPGSQPASDTGNEGTDSCEHSYDAYEFCTTNHVKCHECGKVLHITDWFAKWYLETSGAELPSTGLPIAQP